MGTTMFSEKMGRDRCMDLDKRMRMIRMLDTIARFPDFGARIGLEDQSTFHGRQLNETNQPTPLST